MKSPLSLRKISALDWLCLGAIAFYQRQISPRKGYRCAHARLHGGAGCSGFARDAIAQHGLRAATPLVRTRFGECKLAARTLRNEKLAPTDEEVRQDVTKRRNRNTGWNGWDWLDLTWCFCFDMTFDCGPGDVGCCDCSPCD